jgi:hypothetical protein
MEKIVVCKTVAAHPNTSRYVRVRSDDTLDFFGSLKSLAASIRSSVPRFGFCIIKSEAIGDILLYCGGGTVWEWERLSKKELRELARLLAIEPK